MNQQQQGGYDLKTVLLEVPKSVMAYADAIQQHVPVSVRDNLITNLVVISLPLESGSPDKVEPMMGPDEAYRACVEECVIDTNTGEVMDIDSHDPGTTSTEMLERFIPPAMRPKIQELAFTAHDELYQLWMDVRIPAETRVHDVRTVSTSGVICDFAVNLKSLPPGS